MFRLDSKVAIVTGAASGIGVAIAETFAEQGATVVVADLSADGAAEVAGRLRAGGHAAGDVPFDLGDEASIEDLVARTVSAYGRLDLVVNNAAATHLAATVDAPIATASAEVWDDTMRINLRGTMLVTKHSVPHMIAGGGGALVNLASGAGLSGDLGNPAYGASKAAIISLTQYTATQFGKQGVRANAIAPGLIVTPASETSGHGLGPMRQIMVDNHLTTRLGTPADIAAAAVFLCSDEAAFVTGHVLAVDGGVLAHMPYYSEVRKLTGA